MKRYIKITIAFFVLTIGFLFVGNKALATEACPETMPTQERYLCLQKELNKLESSQGTLQKKLKNEDYQQLSLNDKLKYITTEIEQTEDVIETLGIEVLAQDIEIKILAEDISIKENDISLLNQEINILEQTVNERITQSYKFSHVSPFEYIFDVKNLDSVLRKVKYLTETRINDKNSLKQYSTKMTSLEDEELILANKKAELQKKRNELETEKQRLVEEKAYLEKQQVEKNNLLAESRRREEAYKKELAQTTAMISEMDEKISDLVIALFNSGGLGNGTEVSAGNIIGYQGHTGCSFGSHLHFEIRNKHDVKQDPSLFLYGGAYWSFISSKIYTVPLDGARITQTYKTSSHRAWDMVSTTKGIQDGSTYTVPMGICANVDNYIKSYGRNWAYLTGEGAPIKAVASGKVYYGIYSTNLPAYPCKYALVVHDDGNKSFYLHLK
jgi:peptidoglycan hydrolase CwlO-like protein